MEENRSQRGTYAAADEQARHDLRPGTDGRVAREGEPEEADDEDHGADHHGRQALLGDEFSGAHEFGLEDEFGLPGHVGGGEQDAEEDGDEGERGDAEGDAAVASEANGVGEED